MIWEEKYGDDTILMTTRIKEEIVKADAFVEEETGESIIDYLYATAKGDECWLYPSFYSIEEREQIAKRYGCALDDFQELDLEDAEDTIISAVWCDAENYVDFVKGN